MLTAIERADNNNKMMRMLLLLLLLSVSVCLCVCVCVLSRLLMLHVKLSGLSYSNYNSLILWLSSFCCSLCCCCCAPVNYLCMCVRSFAFVFGCTFKETRAQLNITWNIKPKKDETHFVPHKTNARYFWIKKNFTTTTTMATTIGRYSALESIQYNVLSLIHRVLYLSRRLFILSFGGLHCSHRCGEIHVRSLRELLGNSSEMTKWNGTSPKRSNETKRSGTKQNEETKRRRGIKTTLTKTERNETKRAREVSSRARQGG